MTETLEPEEAPKKKRKKTTSPTARSLAECRKRGWTAGVVEKWNSHVGILQDLFGCIDIIALTPNGILAIQATSGQTGGNHSERVKKVLAEPRARKWVDAGGRFEVWSWRKGGAAGTRKLWTLRAEDVAPALQALTTDERCGDPSVWKGCARRKGHDGGHSTYDIDAAMEAV